MVDEMVVQEGGKDGGRQMRAEQTTVEHWLSRRPSR
jgi:hypothetical protein